MMVQVAHVTGDVQFPKTKNGRVDLGWAAGQVATTADFSHGSWFWTHFSGGLNYQVCPLPGMLTFGDDPHILSSTSQAYSQPSICLQPQVCP